MNFERELFKLSDDAQQEVREIMHRAGVTLDSAGNAAHSVVSYSLARWHDWLIGLAVGIIFGVFISGGF